MTVAALITEGIGPGGSVLFALTGGLGVGSPAPAVATSTQGMGPGWDLFHHQPARIREADTIREDIERALAKAEEAQSPKAIRDAVKELKATASVVVESAKAAPHLARMAQNLERVLRMQQSAGALMKDMRDIMERERVQEQDDLEAFMILAELA